MIMISVVLFEDNKGYRQSLSLYLANTEGIFFSGAYNYANDAVAKVRKHKPNVVLMDIQMPGISGIEAMQRIKAVYPETKMLIQTVFEDDHRVFSAICGGASGYVLKNPNPDELIKAIFDVNEGGACMSPTIALKALNMFKHQFIKAQPTYVDLTEREKEILGCMVKGQSYKMIADTCCLSYHTIHWHVRNIYEKLHINSAPEAVARAIEGRLV